MTETAANIFRDYKAVGVPSSGEYEPEKALLRRWGRGLEAALAAGAFSSAVWKATKALLDADLAHDADSIGTVYDDSAAENNGFYVKSGASGAGSWSQVLPFLPGYQIIHATDGGAGTANAIQATADIAVPSQAYAAMILMNVFEANTGAVTVAIDGGASKALKTNSYNDLAAGYLQAGMLVAFVDDGTNYRLVSDVASSSIVAAADAARVLAEAAAASIENGIPKLRVVATSNLDLSAPGATIDGVAPNNGESFLAAGQTATEENGPYTYNGASSPATRLAAYATFDKIAGQYFAVMEGAAYADTLWRCTSDPGGTLESDPLVFEEFRGGGEDFATVAALLADTELTYSNTSEGDIIFAQGFRYEVAASGASDEHLTTAGGLKLYVKSEATGYNIVAFGALPDGQNVAVTASITSGTASLTATGATFTAADVGKKINVPGAGAAGAALYTTISAYVSATQVTLADNAGTTLTSEAITIRYGTDNTDAIQQALDVLPAFSGSNLSSAEGGGTVHVPIGMFCFTQIVMTTRMSLVGEGFGSRLAQFATANTWGIQTGTAVGTATSNGQWIRIANLTLEGAAVLESGGNTYHFVSTNWGIRANGLMRSVIEQCQITGWGDDGIHVHGGSYSDLMNNRVIFNYGHGIYLVSDDADDWLTEIHVNDNDINSNYGPGVEVVNNCIGVRIHDNVIESNGLEAAPGLEGTAGETPDDYRCNVILNKTTGVFVEGNYFEMYNTFTEEKVQVFVSGYNNSISGNIFNNNTNILLWSHDSYANANYNLIAHNVFSGDEDNVKALFNTGSLRPISNYFIGNVQLSLYEQYGSFQQALIPPNGAPDKARYAVQTVAGGASLTPDCGIVTADADPRLNGLPEGNVFFVTLDQNLSILTPTNMRQGEKIIFFFKQNGTGGYTVSWAGGVFFHSWSDTGNTANKTSSIEFMMQADGWYQLGAQSPYY